MTSETYTKKQKIRKDYIKIRNNTEHRDKKSKIIMNKIIKDEEYKKAKVIALYKSFSSEVDTKDLIKYSIFIGKTVVLPRVIDNDMKFYKIESLNDRLIKNNLGIEEPIEDETNFFDKKDIDLVVVPGVCFDKEKNRLGFGKGFYDRYLMNTNLKTVAICFDEQINDRLPTDENDVKMQKIITVSKTYE